MILVPSWRETTLGELVDGGTAELQTGPFGTMLHASSYREAGTPVVAVKHIGDNKIIHSDMPRIDEETSTRLEKYTLLKDDILFARKGAVSRRALVRAAEEGWIQGSDCIRLRLDSREISPPYVSYCLGTRSHKRWIEQHAHGATMPSLNQEILKLIPLALPDKPTQDGIAHILGTLDDKIELNWRMNRTLEAIARAIFKSWFIDFDPVIDNAILNGKPIPDEFATRAEVRREVLARSKPSPPAPLPKVEGRQSAPELGEVGPSPYERGGDEDVADYAMSGSSPSGRGRGEGVAACRHLFPDEFQDSPLGMIPKGWEVKTIADIAEYVNGRNFTKNASGTGRMVIRIAELNRGVSGSTVFNDVASAPENTAYPDDILFAWSGSLGVFRWNGDEALINQHIFKVIPNGLPKWFVYFHLLQAIPYFRMVAAGKATTMGHIKRAHLADVLLSIPPAKLLLAVNEVVEPLYSRVHVAEQENGALERTRDVLLPYLLSGEFASIRGDAIYDCESHCNKRD